MITVFLNPGFGKGYPTWDTLKHFLNVPKYNTINYCMTSLNIKDLKYEQIYQISLKYSIDHIKTKKSPQYHYQMCRKLL